MKSTLFQVTSPFSNKVQRLMIKNIAKIISIYIDYLHKFIEENSNLKFVRFFRNETRELGVIFNLSTTKTFSENFVLEI